MSDATRSDSEASAQPKLWSARRGRLLLNLYPPFLFQRIKVLSVSDDYTELRLRIAKSLFNRNINGTIFGGSIYTAADPIYALLLWQIGARRGEYLRTWVKTGQVDFLKPAADDLTLDFEVDAALLERALGALRNGDRFVHTFETPACGPDGEPRALIRTEVHLSRRT